MSSNIVKGSRVVRDFHRYTTRLDAGEVITDPVKDPLNQGLKAYVKFDSWVAHPMEVYLSSLILEEEAKAKNSRLEEEFNKLQAEVTAKVDEAAKALREANQLAHESKYSVRDLLDSYHTFIDEVGDAGWNTSSWSC